MAHRKAGGTAHNLNTSNPKYLGVKLYAGEKANPGNIIIRQRGTRILPGNGVRMGTDYTIYADISGVVTFRTLRKIRFNGKTEIKRMVEVK